MSTTFQGCITPHCTSAVKASGGPHCIIHAPAVKHDEGKPRLSLIPGDALVGLARVLEHGASKYGEWNWEQGMEWTRMADAALRHLYSWLGKVGPDEESGLSHLDHAMACLTFLSAYEKRGTGKDDRRG